MTWLSAAQTRFWPVRLVLARFRMVQPLVIWPDVSRASSRISGLRSVSCVPISFHHQLSLCGLSRVPVVQPLAAGGHDGGAAVVEMADRAIGFGDVLDAIEVIDRMPDVAAPIRVVDVRPRAVGRLGIEVAFNRAGRPVRPSARKWS